MLGEAWQWGCLVSTDVGDASYLLDSPEWVVPAASPDILAGKINSMLSCLAERDTRAAADRIRKHFAMDTISRRYYDLYTSLRDGN